MEVVFSENALFMTDCILSDARSLFGEKAFQKLRDRITFVIKHIEWSARYGSLEPALADEEGEYRFVLLNKRFKMIYKVVDEDHVQILTLWDMRQDPDTLKLFL